MKGIVTEITMGLLLVLLGFLMGISYILPGKSESMGNLAESGKLVTTNDTLIYYTDGYLNKKEFLSLYVLSEEYENVFIVDKEDEQI